jgi:hypothetical protein
MVLAAFESALVRLAVASREPYAWEEINLRGALIAMTSKDYQSALDRIMASQRPPSAAELSTIVMRRRLTRAEIRNRFDDLLAAGA